MSTLIADSAATILTKFGTSVAGAAGSWVFKQGLDALTGGSDTTKLKEAIAQVAQQVQQVDKDVQKLSQQLLDDMVTLRTDELNSPMEQITAYYDDITDIVNTALALPATLSASDRSTATAPIQAHLEDRLKARANDVPGLLDTINGYLTETGDATGCAFLQQVAQKTLDDSKDYLGFYGRSKAIVMQYWVVVAKGISLLQMAFDTPNVGFIEGAGEIQRQTDNLQNQEQVFRTTLGIQTVTLAEKTLRSGNPILLAVNLCDNIGQRLEWLTYADFDPRLWITGSTDYIDSGPTLWWIEFPMDVIFNDFDPNGNHTCRLRENATNNLVVINDSDIVVTEIPDSEKATYPSKWYIKPVSPGLDRFSFQFQSDNPDYDGAYMVRVAWGGGNLTTDWSLVTQETADSGQPGMISVGKENHFFISLPNMPLDSLAPELLSLVLQNINSPRGLHNLIAASPACLRVFLQTPYLILSAVLRNTLPSGTIKHYLAASQAPLCKTRDEILSFLDEYFIASSSFEFPANKTGLVSLCQLYHRIDYLINLFLQQIQELGFDESILAPSLSESTRLHRAFLRYEIYCSVFATHGLEPWMDSSLFYEFSGAEQFDLFLRQLTPWEVEEMACVQVYFALVTGEHIAQLEEQLIEAVKNAPGLVWPSYPGSRPGEEAEKKEEEEEDDLMEFKDLDLTNLLLFSQDGIYSSPDSIKHMTSLGLDFLYVLCKSEGRRSELIRLNSPNAREFLPEALNYSPARAPEDQGQGIFAEETDLPDDPLCENLDFILFGKNDNMRTAYLPIDPGGSHRSILRRLGYVFWDSWRIQSPQMSHRLRAVEKMTYDEIHELFNRPWRKGAEARLQGVKLPRDQFEKIEREFGYIEDPEESLEHDEDLEELE
ncbi:hypothetical protein FGADI_4334 [Fusarium gaditjirri]|uniref:Uncharacterized protein n=1 Tax=Fusarium gaditjirri TaxID=282569 RepID=A0A8H4TDA8_9HYPO|nr:hypothetical protein FGADI_4334 [Fusarium gaditjirri]